MRIIEEIRILGSNVHKTGSDHEHMNKLIAWYSRRQTGSSMLREVVLEYENRVADLNPIIRAYLSLCRNCKNCGYDCQNNNYTTLPVMEMNGIRGPCSPVDITEIVKECFTYEQAGRKMPITIRRCC